MPQESLLALGAIVTIVIAAVAFLEGSTAGRHEGARRASAGLRRGTIGRLVASGGRALEEGDRGDDDGDDRAEGEQGFLGMTLSKRREPAPDPSTGSVLARRTVPGPSLAPPPVPAAPAQSAFGASR